jgi:two-component system, NarL family, response regulator LiaR
MNEVQITVCIVEDRIDIRESLCALVDSQANLSCIGTFKNAEDALVGIPELQPNVVLMDIDLPKMNGIDCIKSLKPKCPRVQFMICTVYDEDEKVFEALRTGANGYILKRSPPARLLEAIVELYHGGSPMSSDIARKIVLSFQQKPEEKIQEEYHITPREQEILTLLSKGLSYQELADKLFISSKTVRKHIFNIYEKLHVNSRMEAVNKYFGRV